MGSLRFLIAVGALTGAALSSPAHAADMAFAPPPPLEPLAAPITELGTGWYLRGDVGYVDFGKVKDAPYGPRRSDPIPPPLLDHERLSSTWSLGGGIGYQLNNWLRLDGTVDYRNDARFNATSSASNYVNGFSVDHAKLESTTFLVNGYVDLGSWSGVTPYLGAGIGVAQNRFQDYSGQAVFYPTQANKDAFFIPQTATGNVIPPASLIPAGTTYNLAWALMGGVVVDVGSGFKVDLGYRYTHLGDARTKLDTFGIGTKLKTIDAHEARIGLRYMID